MGVNLDEPILRWQVC